MNDEKRDKEYRNSRFEREEMGTLLKLFTSLGLTVTFGIIVFFLLGLYLDRYLAGMGINTRGLLKIVGVLGGVGISLYWAFLRITRHLKTFDAPKRKQTERRDKTDGET